jgi:hypothetical protein
MAWHGQPQQAPVQVCSLVMFRLLTAATQAMVCIGALTAALPGLAKEAVMHANVMSSYSNPPSDHLVTEEMLSQLREDDGLLLASLERLSWAAMPAQRRSRAWSLPDPPRQLAAGRRGPCLQSRASTQRSMP